MAHLSITVGFDDVDAFVFFDEIANTHFDDAEASISVLKDYMQTGKFSRGDQEFTASCSIVLGGNIDTNLELRQPEITTEVSLQKGSVEVNLTAKSPSLWTWLELDGEDARFSDNFFHLQPAKPVNIVVATEKVLSPVELKKKLRVRSLIDTYV